MKTSFIAMGLLVLSFCSSGQTNPYNQRGADYMASLKMITDDIKAGKVKEFNQGALDQYSKMIPLQTQVSPELVTQIIKTIKAPGFNLQNFINHSSLSGFLKRSISEMYQKSQTPGIPEFQNYLVAKTEEVKVSNASAEEKEAVLTALAFADKSTQTECYLDGPGQSVPVYGTGWCMLLGGIAGFVVGWELCHNIWCAVGGAVIGAVVWGFC